MLRYLAGKKQHGGIQALLRSRLRVKVLLYIITLTEKNKGRAQGMPGVEDEWHEWQTG